MEGVAISGCLSGKKMEVYEVEDGGRSSLCGVASSLDQRANGWKSFFGRPVSISHLSPVLSVSQTHLKL